MVHVLAPRPTDPRLPVFFNVDVAVGRNAPNSNKDDVFLVQYMLSTLGKVPGPTGTALPGLADVPVTGVMNPQTIMAIETVQRSQNVQADGRVSTAKYYNYGAAGNYTVVILNLNMRRRFPGPWPNMDKLPSCPHQLGVACRRALGGVE